MAENYVVGKSYYLPVKVYEVMDDTYAYPVRFEFGKGNGCNTNAIENKPNLLLTAGEIAADFRCRENTEKEKRLEELLVEQTQAINRMDKEIEILIDKITKLETELAKEREKNNG